MSKLETAVRSTTDQDLIEIEDHFAGGADRTAQHRIAFEMLIQQRRIADALERLAGCIGYAGDHEHYIRTRRSGRDY